MTKLSNKPSELIRHALKDLEKCEEQGDIIDMENLWYEVNEDNNCMLCLAGAVMKNTFKVILKDKFKDCYPSNFNFNNKNKLFALEAFRSGQIELGLTKMNIDFTDVSIKNRKITRYTENPEKFKKDMYELAKDLKKISL